MFTKKKISVSSAFILFAALFIFVIKPANASSTDTVKLYLNHNAYVYNNKGARLYGKGNYIKKNKAITAPGKLKQINSAKRYYIRKFTLSPSTKSYQVTALYWLPYTTINNQEYYKIGYNRYIKCINVDSISSKEFPADNSNSLSTNQATVITKDPKNINQKHIYALKKVSKDRVEDAIILPKNKKLIVDDTVWFKNKYAETYHIKGTNYYIYAGDIVKRPRQSVVYNPYE